MDMELDEIFQWQTPFCTLLADIGGISEDGIDGILDQIELSEIQDDTLTIISDAAVGTVATNLSSSITGTPESEPVSSPLWPCDLHTSALNSNGILLPPVQVPAPNFPAASFDHVGSPQSSTAPLTGASTLTGSQGSHVEAPFTPAVRPKRTRATPRATKSTPKAKKPCPDSVVTEQPKEKESRLPTQAEHIIRERQRRDDMAAKYLILESLLPPGPKRERAVVVESAMLLVKDLQQKRSDLLKRHAQLKLMAPSHSPQQVQSKKTATMHESSGFVTTSGCNKLQSAKNCKTDSPISSSIVAQQELISSPGTTNPATISTAVEDPSSGSDQQLHIHVHSSDEAIVIEMVCHQPRQNFPSFLLQAVESFGLDVTRCSMHRVTHGFLQCTITCTKSKGRNASLASSEMRTSATFIGALKNVLTQS